MKERFRLQRGGFTMIELLIVLAILGIIVGIIAMSASPDVRAAVWPL